LRNKFGVVATTPRQRSEAHVSDSGPFSDALAFGRLWYEQAPDAIEYAKFFSRLHDAVIRVYNLSGNVTATHEHKGDFKEW
jgi:hypothetical protein